MGKQLFGTDGIRGVAGDFPLDPKTVYAFGMALGSTARHLNPDPEIVIGMDTRESGPWLAAQVAGGLRARGVRSRPAGVVTTPGIAHLTRSDTFVAGVMISASHNPYQDNGIKVFGHSGFKLPDEEEHAIEQEIFRLLEADAGEPAPAEMACDPGLDRRYLDYLLSTVSVKFDGIRMVVDCGNGAASNLAGDLFGRQGANVHLINCQPNGRNINLQCGALYVEGLARTVIERHADLGVAFDGDADRAIFISATGKVVDGDTVLLMAARALKAGGHLPGDLVVATVMSNLGLERALAREGIRMLRTPVGDKYVLEEMVRAGAALGGEQSGHVIFREYATTGDGMLTALRVLEIIKRSGKTLEELTRDLEVYPQRLYNVRVREKKPLTDLLVVEHEISACEKALGSSGRVLVRYSGTEPLVRVMVEAAELAKVEEYGQRIARAIQREIGVK
ncbi:MAG TPA: phosphoglucosamine mutase [Bryobacteraceae bacterium]|nr:phosphoglucosamine mutase [Bryobacteraceae bacterium]